MDKLGKITLYNADCMDIMRDFPDKAFDLAIVDPPYGISQFKNNHPSRLNKYGDVGITNNNVIDNDYLDELFRVSKKPNNIWLESLFGASPLLLGIYILV